MGRFSLKRKRFLGKDNFFSFYYLNRSQLYLTMNIIMGSLKLPSDCEKADYFHLGSYKICTYQRGQIYRTQLEASIIFSPPKSIVKRKLKNKHYEMMEKC
mmetsp:Transcript_18749/g.32045  ORF Transcript_18749/g.32045 Transcript_18749/m.32045 type:complete len:100 (+) Transcript_18749:204-503(+)